MRAQLAAWAAVVVVASLVACSDGGTDSEEAAAESDLQARAETLAREILIVDGHVDLPIRLKGKMEDVSRRTESGDFDYPRAKAGGLDAPFMSIYTPASFQTEGGAKDWADGLIDLVESLAADHPDQFAVAHSVADVRRHFAEGRISLPLGMENGAPLEGDLANLGHFHQRGIRYITLTHGEDNDISDSSYAETRTWGGLSPFGREVVAEMNRLGIMVDVSHVSDQAFEQALELSEVPVIASHSSCRHFTPGWERNMSDEMIRALAARDGVILINFGSSFLDDESRRDFDAVRERIRAQAEEEGRSADAAGAAARARAMLEEVAPRYADVTEVADHIDHVVRLVGIDHVGLGSDFDGVGDSLPTGLKDASMLPNLFRVLLERGYEREDLEKIGSGNILRVWEAVEAHAAAR